MLRKTHDRFGSKFSEGSGFSILDGLGESFNTLSDGMDGKLKKAATYFEFDADEIAKEDYAFRPDMTFRPRMTYNTKVYEIISKGFIIPLQYHYSGHTQYAIELL